MQAVRFHQHGGPEVLRYEVTPDPAPQAGLAIVRVRACALNHLDLWERRGLERVTLPLPHISGSDVAGEIVGAEGFAVGTRVMLHPGLSCGRCAACVAGRDNLCASYDVLGYRSDGGYAELVKVPLANVIPIPPHVDFVSAAAFPLTFLTAWHMLVTLAKVRPGDQVLVIAAGSGVGQAAVQIARFLGARVLATAGSDEKRSRAEALGAEAVINHSTEEISASVRRLTAGRGVDVVVEHVGQATWEQSVRSLARGGRVVTCGATTGFAATLDLRHLFARQISLLGSYMGTKGELLEAAELFFSGRLRPAIDRTFPLRDAAEAQRRMERREHFGKIVLET
ncbi:MAG TPA: zinc-binding dehydrogenase [Vicinamibacterales bacterium]|nr:zinc-binding dehydrogenase [Vicinamibacterales bacterium]